MSNRDTRQGRAPAGRPGTAWAAVAVLAAAGPAALACGPFFPNRVIANGDDGVLRLPAGDFASEVAGLRPPPEGFRAEPSDSSDAAREHSAAVDVADLDAALAGDAGRPATVAAYGRFRTAVVAHAPAAVPPGLPAEFDRYAQGLAALVRGDLPTARAAWAAVLALPADQRRRRSTWAAYMTARSFLTADPARAAVAFAGVRDLAAAGFADTLGLAAASLGWEAHADLSAHRYPAAIALYLRQAAAGDGTATLSLRAAAAAVLGDPRADLAAVAADATARRVVTAYLLADGGPFNRLSPGDPQGPRWLAAVRAADVTDVAGADRLAWAAYRVGDYAAAADWVARAPAGSAVGGWVRSKLLLRAGRIDEAAAVLGRVVHAFPATGPAAEPVLRGGDGAPADEEVDEARQAPDPLDGDLGVLQLARGQYADALDLLVRSGSWVDAAYVAERVLTPDELRAYVDRHCPAVPAAAAPGGTGWQFRSPAGPTALRCLLARRLTRLGRWRDARPFFTADLQGPLDQYVDGIRGGHDAARPAADRAASLLAAARLARSRGIDLLATELDPDFHAFDGQFEYGEDDRAAHAHDRLTRPTPDELARLKASAPVEDRRWSYRYTAAAHAWAAAGLMPDGQDATAAVLCEAGGWLKDRDPQAALPFYKALVGRCPETALGKRAVAAHWFPKP